MKKRVEILNTEQSEFEIDELINLLNDAKSKGADNVKIFSDYDGELEIIITKEVEMTEEEIRKSYMPLPTPMIQYQPRKSGEYGYE